MDSSLQFGWRENGRKLYVIREGFQEETRFKLVLEILRNLESNDVEIA